jgi:hypothetical protein
MLLVSVLLFLFRDPSSRVCLAVDLDFVFVLAQLLVHYSHGHDQTLDGDCVELMKHHQQVEKVAEPLHHQAQNAVKVAEPLRNFGEGSGLGMLASLRFFFPSDHANFEFFDHGCDFRFHLQINADVACLKVDWVALSLMARDPLVWSS